MIVQKARKGLVVHGVDTGTHVVAVAVRGKTPDRFESCLLIEIIHIFDPRMDKDRFGIVDVEVGIQFVFDFFVMTVFEGILDHGIFVHDV